MSGNPTQSQDQPVLAPTGTATESGTCSSSPTVTGATKADGEELQSYIRMVERDILKETNPVRRQNAEICLGFLKKHGYPAVGYRFLIHQGVTEVLHQDDFHQRTTELGQQTPGCLSDAYGLFPPLTLSPRADE